MAPPSVTKLDDGDSWEEEPKHPSPSAIVLDDDGKLLANGQPFLLDVPPNVTLTPASFICGAKGSDVSNGCFVGFDAVDGEARSRQTASLGRLVDVAFLSIFRFKVWWTTQWVGRHGRDVENETQFLLLDEDSGRRPRRRPYVLLLPIVEGQFRASLQSGHNDNLDVCVESGSTRAKASVFRTCVYMHVASAASNDCPFILVNDAIKVVRTHLDTFKLLDEKAPPAIVDKFGWCTWDAFYLAVHPNGVRAGVKSLADGGCPPGLVIIDDGWQSILHDDDDDEAEAMSRTSAGEQMPCRLAKFEENAKFKGMATLTRELREEFETVEHIYVWHALCGYWGGVRPGTESFPAAKVVKPKLTPGLEKTMKDLAVDKIVDNGVGLVPPEKVGELYEGLHSHLAAVGIDGVKVDVIHLLEMLSEEYGGRVDLAKAYYKALTESVNRHFNGNGVIASMEHGNDFMLLGTKAISLGRVGDDFWCTDPSGDPNGAFWLQGCHMAHCAYNSLWMGNFIHPDWDMFQSTHPCAHFHAASRAVSGGPVYVSDGVGEHDFPLLKSLALPDGTILRCQSYALPTRDCLFADPLHDGKTMLKIWNVNKFSGVLGAFNCQGGGWCPETRRNTSASQFSHRVKTVARPSDIEWKKHNHIPVVVDEVEEQQLYTVYGFRGATLQLLKANDGIDIALDPFDFELLTVSPVKRFSSSGIQFAPIGLANMLNTGGAIQTLEFVEGTKKPKKVHVGVRGAGDFKAYSSVKPSICRIDGEEIPFGYEDGLVTVQVAWTEHSATTPADVEFMF